MNPDKLWFNTPDSETLCRGGGNGPAHPSQLYAIRKYVLPLYNREGPQRLLDYGSGSGTTLEAWLKSDLPKDLLIYHGMDIIPKNIDWCRKQWPNYYWDINSTIHEIDKTDKSFDVVFSRHVVDHMESFEKAMDEHKRVAKKLVIVVLWVPLSIKDEHEIKNIDYRPSGGIFYPNEYTNSYSRKLVMEYLKNDPQWELLEITEDVGAEVSGHDIVICLRRKS